MLLNGLSWRVLARWKIAAGDRLRAQSAQQNENHRGTSKNIRLRVMIGG
jgi:hypothetical protein